MDAVISRRVTEIAAQACSMSHFADGLSSYSEQIMSMNGSAPDNIYRKLADIRNLLCQEIEYFYDGWISGEPEACRECERRLRTLSNIVNAWGSFQTPIG